MSDERAAAERLAALLRERADTYDRDRAELRALGWTDFERWFGSMRDELRQIADSVLDGSFFEKIDMGEL